MSRPRLSLLLLFVSLLALPALAAQPCNLEISMTCTTGQCTSTTINDGPNSCSGQFIAAIFSQDPSVKVGAMTTSLGLPVCFDTSTFPTESPVSFAICFGDTSLAAGASFTASSSLTATGATVPSVSMIAETIVSDTASGDELAFVYAFNDVNLPTCTPTPSVASTTLSGVPYSVSWTAVSQQGATYIVEESTSADFSAITARTTTALSEQFQHSVTANTTYYYRVHAVQCSGAAGPLSPTASINVQAAPPSTARGTDAVVPFGTNTPVNVPLQVHVNAAGKTALDTTFTAKTDKPYLNVTPSSGTIPASGNVNLTVTATPGSLPPGANTGTVSVTSGNTTTNVPVSISLVTPVASQGKTFPPGNALIIPAVTHAAGFSGPFQSDLRLLNNSLGLVKYQVTYTPTRTDGTASSKATIVPVDPGQSIALNDVVRDFFGNDAGFGSLEIRPVNNSTTLSYASSRTYVTTAAGTFGQFIAAIPFAQFASKAIQAVPIPGQPPGPTIPPTLSFQQVAQSAKFRTNLGLVEGSGTAANGRIRVFDDAGNMLRETPFNLKPGEHQQLDRFIEPLTLTDGRIEVVVDSDDGAVSGYASVLDNLTSDPLAVMPAQPLLFQANRYVIPGMAEIVSPFSNFHSDVRVFNGGTSTVTVTPTFYPSIGAAITGTPFSLGPNAVKAVDDVLPTLFNTTGGGSVTFTTSVPSNLVTTGRTYSNAPAGGTFGQFIPGVAPAQGVGAAERTMQILQLEQSDNFRSNVGVAELTGNPVHIKVSATVPDSKVAASFEDDLQPNQFKQYNGILTSMGFTNAYNARISVQVLSGSGRITAYGSVIDNQSTDPTYVPAQ